MDDADQLGGFFSDIARVAGGIAGGFVGQPELGKQVAGYAAGAAEQALRGKKKKRAATPAQARAAAPAPPRPAPPRPAPPRPAPAKNRFRLGQGAAPGVRQTVTEVAKAIPAGIAQRTAVARQVSSIMGQAGVPYETLARAAGLSAATARAHGIPGSELVKRAGLPKLAKVVGAPSAASLMRGLRLPKRLAQVTGLTANKAKRVERYGVKPCDGAVRVIIEVQREKRRPFKGAMVLGDLEGPSSRPARRVLRLRRATGAPVTGARALTAGGGTGRFDDTGPIPGLNTDFPDGPEGEPAPLPEPGDAPPAPPAPKGGVPGPVAVRAENWDFAGGRYRLANGDTLQGLALTYLPDEYYLDGVRAIWAAQPEAFRAKRQMNGLYAGEWLNMPPAAVATAKRLTGKGGLGAIPWWGWALGGTAVVGAGVALASAGGR